MKLRNVIILFLTCSLVHLYAQNTTVNKIDDYLIQYKNNIPIPGFSVVIVEKNRIIFSKGYGLEKAGTNKAITPETPIGIGSVGRGFTAVAIMQLVEKGLVKLDEPVTTYLPWFKTANKNFSDLITVRMCLNNTSGIPPLRHFSPDLHPSRTLEKFVRSMSGTYIQRKPGTSHNFSDEGYSIAGLIISKISGLSYPDYIQHNILKPLQMTHSTTDPARFEALNSSYGHELSLNEAIPAYPELIATHYLAAGAEMRSSARDLGHYLIALLNDGQYQGERILSSESIEELFIPDISFRGLGTMLGGNGLDIGYALGWMAMKIEERDILIHTGNSGTMASIIGLNRGKSQGIAMLFNTDVNRLDRFVYPTLENTANNVIHLLNNEDTTDFAVVRIEDPFDDDFSLETDRWNAYIGEYRAFGNTHNQFADTEIEILIGASNKLELIARKANRKKGHYLLQFINESRAVLRSIAHPREIQFKIFPNGTIGGLYMSGVQFQKKSDAFHERFHLIESPDKIVSCQFPKSATVEWTGNQMNAKWNEAPERSFIMNIDDLHAERFEDFSKKHIQEDIYLKGPIKDLNVRDGIWTEQIMTIREGNEYNQVILIRYQDPISQNEVHVIISFPWGAFSSELQQIIMNLQQSLSFKAD